MSKLKNDKINFNEKDFVVQLGKIQQVEDVELDSNEESQEDRAQKIKEDVILNAQKEKDKIIKEALDEKEKIIEEAKKKAQEIINEATLESHSKEEEAKKAAQELLENSKEELEKISAQAANEGYQEGYKDAQGKLIEELEEKIEKFDKFCSKSGEIREKILKSASYDILNIISNISKKILIKELDGEVLDKIIKKTILMFEKKEDINIILSKNYAQLLFEFQKKNLSDDIELKFEDFKQYDNFNIVYSPELDDDTIILENIKERFDSSINSQLDIIIRNIYEKSSNGQLDLKDYIKEQETNNETE